MIDAIAEVITLPRIFSFCLGMLAGQGISWGVNRWRVKNGKEPSPSTFNAVVGVVIIAAMVWIMVATQQARNCALDLNVAVSNEQEIDAIERNAFQNAIADSLRLPAEIRNLPNNDPRRKAVTDPIQERYLVEVARAQQMRKDNQAIQDKAHDSCGA
jgi:hypothetical protein